MYLLCVILGLVFATFVSECVLAQVLPSWHIPNLLLILVVFFNLYRGTRYSLVAGIVSGLFKDSFSAGPFGLYTFAFIITAFFTTLLKMYVYQPGAMASRVLLVFLVTVGYVTTYWMIQLMFTSLAFPSVFFHILVPEVGLTTLIAPVVFKKYRQCALRLFA
ncbi:MAG TPA: rod shape-determining protein MreD [Candidatus Omnitrophota bacterium]|nr:rod shape-determining protein MreD [Candidatus Omnitrophota bacterium]HPB67731.1 rod shape-determining protein MreD [Candidatus Omnitrophota bacterium]HQO57113.1 rod shape-determining protein MreD [Candidatus Omnitrophota bacterium]HQP11474.1 rod shape-determining protein MreD [Candidatus Omnitrophota bacterium]